MPQQIRHFYRRIKLRINRFRSEYQIRNGEGSFRLVIPQRHQRKIRLIKYFLALVGLLSAFFVFGSVWIAFIFGVAIYLASLFLEKVAFAHAYAFIHPMPDFEINPEKWVGMGFGYVKPPTGDDIPLVSMMVTELELAKNLVGLFLKWTDGSYKDESKNVQISVVVIRPDEYVFLCYPNPKRPVAKKFFQSARDKLRNASLEDEIAEHHISLVLGKRCKMGRGSYFLEFRRRYRPGVPILFEFIFPPFNNPTSAKDVPNFVFFDFSIKDESELTRKDFAYDAIWSFKRGGKWQGPVEE